MELSLVVCFDELRRCQDVLTDGTAEIGKSRSVRKIFNAFEIDFLQWKWNFFHNSKFL